VTDTKKEIKRLKALLPHMRERLSAVAFLLVLSLVMVTATSYAWITLSSNPEVGGVNTTVAANGSLEVALSDFDGEAPEESGVDSFSAEGQTTHGANTTWGNLINLSTGYGVENLVLRPATLELEADALLYGVRYGQDGRVEGSASDFGFTTWYQTDEILDTWKFVSPDEYPSKYEEGKAYGVRAISSITYEGQADANQIKLDTAAELQRESKNYYYQLTTDPDNLEVIRALVDKYLDENINAAVSHLLSGGEGALVLPNFELNGKTFVPPLTKMLDALYNKAVLRAGDALVYMANLQKNEGVPNYTVEDLVSKDLNYTTLLNNGVKLTALGYNKATNKYTAANNLYKTLYDSVRADYEAITSDKFWDANGEAKKTIYWNDLEPIVNNLLNISTMKVDGKTINEIAGMGMGAIDFVEKMDGRRVSVLVSKGNLWNFEDLTAEFASMDIPVSVHKNYIIKSVDCDCIGVVTTTVSRTKDSRFAVDMAATEAAMNVSDTRKKVGQDTYGMILDLWVRTNGENSLLTLNGTPKVRNFQTHLHKKFVGENEARPVYNYNRYTGNMIDLPMVGLTPETEQIEVYKGSDGIFYNAATYEKVYWAELLGPDENGNYYVNDTEELLTENHEVTAGTPALEPKMVEDFEVIGYESANRIWTEGDWEEDWGNNPPYLEEGELSATQGSGSCYIFYSDSPEAYERAKELLSNLKLVFLDSSNKALAYAYLDVNHTYQQSGKYIVPIAITSSTSSVMDEDGNEILGICNLRKNEATRISVLVYLDGEALDNDMVMSSEAITGSLNLQFESTADLHSIGDSDLAMDIISLNASVDNTSFNYSGERVTTNLKALITGLVPAKVEAVFMRQINSAQGTRMATVELNDDDKDNTWNAEVPFTTPGTYVLNSLWIDGVEYPLPEKITVTVEGFKISEVVFLETPVMTANKNVTRDVAVTMVADQAAQPQTMQARFMTSDGHSVNANMSRNGDTWTGSATFFSSDTYTLQYLIMDGEYYELNDGLDDEGNADGTTRMQRSFTAYLGLTTKVILERYQKDANDEYVLDANGNRVILPLEYFFEGPEDIFVFAQIYDDAGNVMRGLDNVEMWYKSATSVNLENGYKSELEWKGEYYEGKFDAKKAGSFLFAQMNVGGEVINAATSAPTLRIIPKNPPEFIRSASDAVIVSPGVAYYRAEIAEASAATIWAVFNDGTRDYEVEMSPSGTTDTYQAAFPDLDETSVENSNGKWKVKELRFAGVYANGKFYDVGGTERYSISVNEQLTVLNYMKVELSSIQVGGTKLSPTGLFGTEYQLNNLKDGKPLSFDVVAPGFTTEELDSFISSVKLTLTHDEKSVDNGGYRLSSKLAAIDVPVAQSIADGKLHYAATDKSVIHAGGYTYAVTIVTAGGVTINSGTGFKGIAVEVFSKRPTVTIPASGGIDTTAHEADTAGVKGAGHMSVTPERTSDYEATVYIKCTVTGSCSKTHNYTVPTVMLSLNNVGNMDKAVLSFGADTHVYNGSTQTGSFEWDESTGYNCKRTIGSAPNTSTKVGAGDISASELVITIGQQTCTVDLVDEVKIHNPY